MTTSTKHPVRMPDGSDQMINIGCRWVIDHTSGKLLEVCRVVETGKLIALQTSESILKAIELDEQLAKARKELDGTSAL